MAQHDLNIANQSFPSFRTDLNNALSAIQTTHSGTSAPPNIQTGQIWLDTTSPTTPTLKYYDGADNISLATLDHSANTVNWLDSTVSITGLSTTATGTVLTLSDTNLNSTVSIRIPTTKGIDDDSGNEFIKFTKTASAVNELTIINSATGSAPEIQSTGDDTNIDLKITTKGTGDIFLNADTVSIGDSNADAVLTTNGTGDITVSTNSGTNSGTVKIFDGANGNIEITPNGTGVVKLDGISYPTADGSSGQVLQTNGSGVLSFSSVGGITRGTVVASTSGTSIDFTSLPSTVKRITVMFSAVSTNGTSIIQVQLGDSGGIENTGYVSASGSFGGSSFAAQSFTTGFGIRTSNTSAATYQGSFVITNLSSNTWVADGSSYENSAYFVAPFGGTKTLSDTLDRVRITTVNGTDTFDAGSINIMYES